MKQTGRIPIRALSFLLLVAASLSSYGKMPITTEAFDSISFEIGEDGKIFVNATVNEDTIPLRFLFDTGAVDNVLNIKSQHALRTINLDSLIDGIGKTTTTETKIKITPYEHSITLGETEFQGVRFILSPCMEDIDGIIGWNTMTGADFLIDYDTQQIKYFDGGECLIEDQSAWITLSFIDGLPSINLDFDFDGDSYQTNVWLDSGSDRCFDLSTPYILNNQLQGKQKPWGESKIADVDGVGASIEEVFVDKVQIGDYTLYQIPMGLNLSNSGNAANCNFGGVIGNNLLQRFNQIWSFASKRLYLQPNKRLYAAPYKPMNDFFKNKKVPQNP